MNKYLATWLTRRVNILAFTRNEGAGRVLRYIENCAADYSGGKRIILLLLLLIL